MHRYTCTRSEEHTSELQSRRDLVCRLLLEKKIMMVLVDLQEARVLRLRLGAVDLATEWRSTVRGSSVVDSCCVWLPSWNPAFFFLTYAGPTESSTFSLPAAFPI